MRLTGIGSFHLNPKQVFEATEDKNSKNNISGEISFVQDATIKEDEKLVLFISSQSGKMKSLAASDIDSYLELAKQFLNIGKPFLIEGIGSLSKNKSGSLDFTPDPLQSDKIKEHASAISDQTSSTEDSFTNYEEMLSPKKPKTPASKKLVLWLTIITGIGLAVWGGYIVYTKKTEAPVSNETILAPEPVKNTDTVKAPLIIDSSGLHKTGTSTSNDTYKFVIENSGRFRALKRFSDLKKWGVDIQMETKDSINFKLFFKLAALPKDTARIKDSLTLLYGSMGRARIEQ